MKTVAAMVLMLAMPGDVAAHRLDEYLQAARLGLGRERVMLQIDLTPGVSVAAPIVSLIDRDNDGTISPAEAEAYGRAVLSDLVLTIDGRAVRLSLGRVETSSPDAMRQGMGMVQVHMSGDVPEHVGAGRHHVYFRNNHHPDGSVYLVNALLPDDAGVSLVAQRRDPHQRHVFIDYDLGRGSSAHLWWLVLGAGGLLVINRQRRTA